MPELTRMYHNLYDINLVIYSARKELTVIDIRYYPKSALDHEYRQTVLDKPPMLHCKVAMPPGLDPGFDETIKKFDINWEHYEVTGGLKMHKIYKQSVIYPAILLLIIAVLYAVEINLLYDMKQPVYETVAIHLIAALLYGLVICTLALTIYLNRFGRISASRTFSLLSWFLLPGAFFSLAVGKAINEYLTVNSVWEIEYALIASMPFIAGLTIGFRKFRTLPYRHQYP